MRSDWGMLRSMAVRASTLLALLSVGGVLVASPGCKPAATPGTQTATPTPVAAPAPEPDPQPEPEVAPQPKPDPEPAPDPLAKSEVAQPWTAQTVPPLSDARKEVFFGSPEDEAPETLGGIAKALEDVHYVIGNEWALQAFREDIKDIGGGYMGVGPDQAYLFIGWQRPELAWLADYDPAVKRVHALYRALLMAAKTPEEFVAYFDKNKVETAAAAIASTTEGAETKSLQAIHRRNRKWFFFRLRKLRRKLKEAKVDTYLTDQATFDYIKAMLAANRIRPMVSNLNDTDGVAGITKAAKKLDVPIRVVYVSNAEEYWKTYDPNFRANMAALHTDDQSVFLRTRLIWKINEDYMYIVQPFDNLRAWLADPSVERVKNMLGGRPTAKADKINHYRIKRLPPSAKPAS